MKIPFDYSTSVGDEYYATERSFLIILNNKTFELHANTLEEVNEYLKENHAKDIESPFSIIEITNSVYKLVLDKKFTDELVKNIKSLFYVTSL